MKGNSKGRTYGLVQLSWIDNEGTESNGLDFKGLNFNGLLA